MTLSRRTGVLVGFMVALILLVTAPVILAAGSERGSDPKMYLPLVLKDSNTLGASTGTLTDGGTLQGLDGLTIGAVTGTLTTSVEVTFAGMLPPAESLPMDTQVVSSYYQVSSNPGVYPAQDKPLILGIPVPNGANTDNLAVAELIPTAEHLDTQPDEANEWILAPGTYDAGSGMFLFTLPYLSPDGQTFALVEHAQFGAARQTAARFGVAAGTPNFFVLCLNFTSAAECGTVQQDTLAAAARVAYEDYTEDFFGMGYKSPRLLGTYSTLSFQPPEVNHPHDTYFLYLKPAGQGSCKPGILGYYTPISGYLVICIPPSGAITHEETTTLRHEYFHATQYAYDEIINPVLRNLAKPQNFIIEGTATAAEESLFDMHRASILPFSLHPVDVPLTAETAAAQPRNMTDQYEYKAQDFWVFLGENSGWGLDYLIPLFDRGARVDDVVEEFGDGDFLDPYWSWVKNQVMEKGVDFDAVLQNPCEVESPVVEQIEQFNLFWDSNLTHLVNVAPLNSIVVKVNFDLVYDGADGWVFPAGPGQDPDAQQALRYKLYEHGESGCVGVPDGRRIYENVVPTKEYYVVISNIDYEKDYDYVVAFEVWPVPVR